MTILTVSNDEDVNQHPGLFRRVIDFGLNLINSIEPSRNTTLYVAAIVVGLFTGLGGFLFIRLIEWIGEFLFGTLPELIPIGRAWLILIPMIGGLIAGPIIAFFAAEAKGHGVPEVMQAIALNGGRIRPRVAIAKVMASSACIGSGGSAGREGPIVQVGAALGSTIAQWLHFSESRIRNLVACGAAAGIAATFNAPIAGVIFAIEVILGELTLSDLGSVVLSAVSASIVARNLLGDTPAFGIPLYEVKSHWEIILYVILGAVSALIGVLFIKSLSFAEDFFDNWKFPGAFKPAIGGLLLGITGFLYPLILGFSQIPEDQLNLGLPIITNIPQIYGSGFESIEASLLGQTAVLLMFVLIFLKVLATSFTLGSGNSGGVFAPALFMGSMTGGVFGSIATALLPGIAAGSGPYATVGMAAVFSAAARAPLTAILIVFEMTDDFRILVPLMAAVAVSTALAQHMHKDSIYTLKLTHRGIRIFRGRDMDVMASVFVHEVMEKNPETVSPELSVNELVAKFDQTGRHGFNVVDEDNHLIGIVSLSDVRKMIAQDKKIENLKVKDLTTRTIVSAYPDETLREVLQRMAPRDLSRMPVVSRQNPKKLVGVIRRRNVIKAYDMGLVRRGFALGSLPGSPPGSATGRFPVPKNSYLVGKTLAELCLPDDFLVIHLERDGEMIMPHGITRLEAGDTLTLLSHHGNVAKLDKFWQEIIQRPIDDDKEETDCST
jgi:CIC family chloride channel protein